MPKRLAEKQLTQDNAEQYLEDDDSEEAGTFQKANKDAMSTRIIKSAVRRKPEGADTGSKGLFARISFSGVATGSSSLQQPTSSLLLGQKSLTPSSQMAGNSLLRPSFGTSSATPLGGSVSSDGPFKRSSQPPAEKSAYLTNLKNLNTSVLEWIQKHVKENPYIDLTPVFKDYQKHIQDIEEKFDPESSVSAGEGQVSDSEGSQSTDVTATNLSQGSDVSAPPTQPQTTVVSALTLLQTTAGSGSQMSSQFTLPPSTSTTANDQQDSVTDEDAPPVVAKSEPGPGETRAKLFYKKGEEYVSLGVGFLTVEKKAGKAWLLMRSDTVTKKTLLSVYISSSTPLQLMEKNIIFVAPPNPPLDPKNPDDKTPVSYVVRVKTAEDATKLYDSIKEAAAK